MTAQTESPTWDSVVESAMAELDTLPGVGDLFDIEDDQTILSEVEQPAEESEAPEAEDESLFEDIVEDVVSEPPAPTIPENAVFELPGVDAPVTLQDLKDGYLRTADYTRKTQQLAEERKAHEQAVNLWNALQNDPEGVVRYLASEAGFIPEDAAPLRPVEFSPLKTKEAVEAELNARLAKAVEAHPLVQEARIKQAQDFVEREFARVETDRQVKLTDKDRKALLKVASTKGMTDLGAVFDVLMAEKQRKMQGSKSLQAAAPGRSTGRTTTKSAEAPDSFAEAAQMAAVELGLVR